MSTRLTISRSIGVLPTRSPMPSIGAVDARRAGLERGEAVDRAHVAIAMPVPVDAHVRTARLDDAFGEAHDGARASRRRVTDGIGDAQPVRTGIDGGLEQPAQRVGIGARRVFGDVHHLQALTYAEPDRFLGAALQIVHRPVFGVLADRARADEAAALDRQPGPLNDVGDRLNVGDDRAGDTVGLDVRRHSTISAASRSTSRTTCGPAPGSPMRRCRCRCDRAGAGCAASGRSSGRAPTATAARRAASRH